MPYLGEYALPGRFTAIVTPQEADLPICHLVIAVEDGRPVCIDLGLERRPNGPPLNGGMLRRITLGDFVERAVERAGHARAPGPVTFNFDGEQILMPSEATGDGHVAMPISGLTHTKLHQAAKRKPRGELTDETLQQVAETYRTALATRKAPTKAVMKRWFVSRSTASRWVKRAREAGFLGPARPRVAGEEEAE